MLRNSCASSTSATSLSTDEIFLFKRELDKSVVVGGRREAPLTQIAPTKKKKPVSLSCFYPYEHLSWGGKKMRVNYLMHTIWAYNLYVVCLCLVTLVLNGASLRLVAFNGPARSVASLCRPVN